MNLNDFLEHLDTKVPIIILEKSPPEHPDELQHTEVIYDSEDSCSYMERQFMLGNVISGDLIITKITLLDDNYPPRLKINVISMER